MGSEANKDEAAKCLEISQQHHRSGNIHLALKYAAKSISLFETNEASVWLEKIKIEATDCPKNESKDEPINAEPSSGQYEKTSKKNGNDEQTASYTDEQVTEVKRFQKINKSDYYAVLGVPKEASDTDMKKAYRKVRHLSYIWSNIWVVSTSVSS